ncbi:GNAT family N-acetyltransferase [Tuberibacillus sp. Marseille-P3662]|uniref:GNAT family N-acetyltransferase n=1 Tax=Tuberibacillus sp. Marseille-P3662 TaxID=1965358 RepID=UPI000A1C8502|nr:GNAT family N-acetyltransferase [Tuberibacillus sp. Marseille-P3662]
MAEQTVVKELTTDQEALEAFPVMRQLRQHLNHQTYLEGIQNMREQGYRLFALYYGNDVVAVAGLNVMMSFAWGRYVWVHDLVTGESQRSKGYGKQMLEFIHNWAREQDCDEVALSSGVQRTEAHRFYEDKMGYRKKSFVFRKRL